MDESHYNGSQTLSDGMEEDSTIKKTELDSEFMMQIFYKNEEI